MSRMPARCARPRRPPCACASSSSRLSPRPRRRAARCSRSRTRSRPGPPGHCRNSTPGKLRFRMLAHLVGDLALRELALLGIDERDADEPHVRARVRAGHRAARVARRADVGQHQLDGSLAAAPSRAVVAHRVDLLRRRPRATCRAPGARRRAPSTRRSRGRTCSAGGAAIQTLAPTSTTHAPTTVPRNGSARAQRLGVAVGDAHR